MENQNLEPAVATPKPPRNESRNEPRNEKRYKVVLSEMSNSRLRTEIKKHAQVEAKANRPEGIIWTTVLGIIFDSSRETNPKATMESYLR